MVNIIRGGDVVIHRPFFFLLEEVEGTAGACMCMWITTESRGVTVIVTVLSSSVALPHGRKTKACRLSVTIVANNLARVRKTLWPHDPNAFHLPLLLLQTYLHSFFLLIFFFFPRCLRHGHPVRVLQWHLPDSRTRHLPFGGF